MKELNLGFTLCLSCLSVLSGNCKNSKDKCSEKEKMNVLFIMSDQHNANALGCYGHDVVKTPNLDRLAANGVLFKSAYCQTGQSVPSRFSIFTGRYARSTGTYSNGNLQKAEENTVADLFSKEGYICATIGKHHMVMNETNNNHGFDAVEVPVGGHIPVNHLPKDEVYPGRSLVGESAEPNEKHSCGLIAKRTIDFIRDNKEKPFVVWCSFHGPHTPIVPSSPWSRMYSSSDVQLPPNHNIIDENMPGVEGLISKSGKFSSDIYHKKTTALYWGLISQIDYNIGLLIDELKRLGLDKKTIIVYTADHGEMMGEHKCWTKGTTAYEATIRVPCIISCPSLFSGGQVRDELVCSIDLLPTLLDCAGINIPSNIQGCSLLPLMKNQNVNWRDYIFTEIGSSVNNDCVGVRSHTAKYVRFKKNGKVIYEQLFDEENDPWKTVNQINNPEYGNVLNNLKNVLHNWENNVETSEPYLPKKKRISLK